MNRSNIFERGFSLCRVATVFALLFAGLPTANAVTREITAVFRPDSSKPTENKFINTTPVSGYCATWPSQCTNGQFSIRLPISFASSGPIQANHSDSRQGAMLKVPANWRRVQVTNSSTGESEVVEIRVSGFGFTYRLSSRASILVGGGVTDAAGHKMLWAGSDWVNPARPCTYSGLGYLTSTDYTFFWKTPQESPCAKQAKYLIPGMRYLTANFAYELRTPNPLKMSVGHYRGTLNYGVGPGQDFDMGDVMLPNDSVLTLNFNLEVQHTLKVEIPPGGNRVVLEPQGGWQAWLNQGRKPTRLFRDQMFHIWASSRFKMGLECQYSDGSNTCALWEPASGHTVPVEISVTLPPGLTDAAGQSVIRRRLYRDGSGTKLFQPGHYVERKPGTLHFEIVRDQVEEMLGGGAKTYAGNVTVIWDSEV